MGDLFAPLPVTLRGRVDVLLANAPYVPTAELQFLPTEAREHEPARALDGGHDGLEVHRRIMAGASTWLAPGGRVFAEVTGTQAGTLRPACVAAGLRVDLARDDDLEVTVLVASRRRDRSASRFR